MIDILLVDLISTESILMYKIMHISNVPNYNTDNYC